MQAGSTIPCPKAETQLERVIEMLKETPLTNQAVVEVGDPEDHDVCFGNDGKLDPPCLRLLDFKAIPAGEELMLTVSCYFRSWDLWAGFPTNLGGIETAQKTCGIRGRSKERPDVRLQRRGHILRLFRKILHG